MTNPPRSIIFHPILLKRINKKSSFAKSQLSQPCSNACWISEPGFGAPNPGNEIRTIKFCEITSFSSTFGNDEYAVSSPSEREEEEEEGKEKEEKEKAERGERNVGNKNVGNESSSGKNQTVNEYTRIGIHEEAGTFGRRGY